MLPEMQAVSSIAMGPLEPCKQAPAKQGSLPMPVHLPLPTHATAEHMLDIRPALISTSGLLHS